MTDRAKELIDLFKHQRDKIIEARNRVRDEAAHSFLVSQGWDGADMEKAKEMADKFICEENPDGTISFRKKTEEEIASEELLPCPFCGGEAYIKEESDAFSGIYNVARCKECGVEVSVYVNMTKTFEWNRQRVIEKWNRRPSPVQKETDIGEVIESIKQKHCYGCYCLEEGECSGCDIYTIIGEIENEEAGRKQASECLRQDQRNNE